MSTLKLFRQTCLFSLLVLLASAGVSGAWASVPGQAAAMQVSESSYYDFMDNWLYTHQGDNRGPSGPDLVPCRENIVYLMQSYGLDVTIEPFTYSSGTYHNVVGTLWGTVDPDIEYVIGAHYDSVSNPGADDNASGVALVLECARILSQYESDYTIRFVAFSMEEVGLVGSSAYVSAHAGDDIRGMISADMVAYDTGTNIARIYGRDTSATIKNALGAAIDEYSDGLTWTDSGRLDASDHAPFESAGYQACLLIEGLVWSNPYYHSSGDYMEQPNYLDFTFATRMTRSVAGWLVDQAGVLVDADYLTFDYPDDLPELVSPAGGTAIRVDVIPMGDAIVQAGSATLHVDIGSGWETYALTDLGSNQYEAVIPAAPCGDSVLFYFSAEDIDSNVFTDPINAPGTYHTALAAYGEDVFYSETLDSSPGWFTEGLWSFGQPAGSGGDSHGNPDPDSGYTGDYVYGYNLAGDYENGLDELHLTSTAIDCTGKFGVKLNFWRWLNVEQPSYDHAYVRVSNDGNTWTTVWENSSEVADADWTEQTLDISAVADDQPAVYLRWTMGETDGSWQYSGWNIDDVSLSAFVCTAPYVPGDSNCDAAVNFDDIDCFVAAIVDEQSWLDLHGGSAACGYLDVNDLNGDTYVNFDDIDGFIAAIVGG